ncbi:hypothetical protein [Beijerinckia sp. L45]|uniref:hypothetical protein n=1 Tax=Beijerinckia sp. L45 TaxID=1641855 RepID=UPI00131CA08B|nr:hypothetical protein [Beijerinckia sp. L45]
MLRQAFTPLQPQHTAKAAIPDDVANFTFFNRRLLQDPTFKSPYRLEGMSMFNKSFAIVFVGLGLVAVGSSEASAFQHGGAGHSFGGGRSIGGGHGFGGGGGHAFGGHGFGGRFAGRGYGGYRGYGARYGYGYPGYYGYGDGAVAGAVIGGLALGALAAAAGGY